MKVLGIKCLTNLFLFIISIHLLLYFLHLFLNSHFNLRILLSENTKNEKKREMRWKFYIIQHTHSCIYIFFFFTKMLYRDVCGIMMTCWKKEEIFPSSPIISKVKGKIFGIARNNFTAFNAFLPQLHSPCLIRHNVLKIKRIIVGERRDFLALKSFYYFSYIYVKLLYIRHNAEGCYSMS